MGLDLVHFLSIHFGTVLFEGWLFREHDTSNKSVF